MNAQAVALFMLGCAGVALVVWLLVAALDRAHERRMKSYAKRCDDEDQPRGSSR
jgi:hypothetical protein